MLRKALNLFSFMKPAADAYNTWLKKHSQWNHQEWASLIEDLSTQGFHEWTDIEQGRNEIGFYLETKRR